MQTNWNIITAFDKVLETSEANKGLIPDEEGQSAAEYLMNRLNMTQMQVIILAMFINEGSAMSWNGMAKFLNISRLKMMTYTDDVEDLLANRCWLKNAVAYENGRRYKGYSLVYGVITALRHDEPFVPERLDGLDIQSFVERITASIMSCLRDTDDEIDRDDVKKWLMNMVEQNTHLSLCKEIMDMCGDMENKCLLLLAIADYVECAGRPNEGLNARTINGFFPADWKCHGMRKHLSGGDHELMAKGWLEFKYNDGMADPNTIVLTQKAKDVLLAGFVVYGKKNSGKAKDRDLVPFGDIQEKQLYYNEKEQKVVNRLRKMLSQEQFPLIQQRLKDEGMRTGVAVLLNGGPGTGKTELVRQLCRETGRDMLMIDVSQVKDKFVGESEKNCKAIFDRYKHLCKHNEVKPILFINECDAILGKRLERVDQSSDKMLNSMQNILLQAIEDFDGIMICTTNLAEQGLDKAFMRRFLIKAEFTKPDAKTRSCIWQSMMSELTEDDANTLAARYDFSGGQCENVKRKATIEHIINGKEITMDILDEFCQEECILEKSALSPIKGFAV